MLNTYTYTVARCCKFLLYLDINLNRKNKQKTKFRLLLKSNNWIFDLSDLCPLHWLNPNLFWIQVNVCCRQSSLWYFFIEDSLILTWHLFYWHNWGLQSFCRWKSSQRASRTSTLWEKSFSNTRSALPSAPLPHSQNDWINGWSFYFRYAPASLPGGCRSWRTLGAFTCAGVMLSLVNTEREQETKKTPTTLKSRRKAQEEASPLAITSLWCWWRPSFSRGPPPRKMASRKPAWGTQMARQRLRKWWGNCAVLRHCSISLDSYSTRLMEKKKCTDWNLKKEVPQMKWKTDFKQTMRAEVIQNKINSEFMDISGMEANYRLIH